MPPSVYQPTPLPARINLDDLDTQKQLNEASKNVKVPANVASPDPLGSVPPAKKIDSVAQRDRILRDQLNQSGRKVIEDDLAGYLEERKLRGKSSGFRDWIRRFHSEYDDAWFNSNFIRLENAFLPIWMKLSGEEPSISAPSANLLDFWDSEPPPAPSKPADDSFFRL